LKYSTFVPISRLLARILLASDSATSALSSASSNSCWAFLNLIKHTDPGLKFLKLFLSTLHSQVFSLIQAMLQVFNCDLQVLLHPLQVSAGVLLLPQLLSHHGSLKSQGVVPAPDLGVQSGLHRLHHPLVVPLHLVDLLVFLCQLSVNFSLHLVQVHLYP
uniref:Uncharacterized protein n=1 Tax=Amphiprion percula TaxID=161767 RepID=A0A3P8TS44_AMPPE